MVNWCFGDSFDLYAAPADAIAGYWDSGSGGLFTLQPGRFTGGQCIRNFNTGVWLVKSSTSTTDTIHHIVCAFQQTAALSGTTLSMYLTLGDGATAQCSIVFRSDGAIILTSGGPVGTALGTAYTGAVPLANQWYAFEIEVVIHPTAGSWAVRRGGNTVNDHADTGLNTRPGTNTQANRLTVGMNATVNNQQIDDLLWRSDASSVPWVGDVRTYVRMPASDASVQFTKGQATLVQTPVTSFSTSGIANTVARYAPFAAAVDGTISTATVSLALGYTGNMKCTLFAGTASVVGAVLGSATPISNPATGNNTFTFSTPVTVTKGTQYWIGFITDTTSGTWTTGPTNSGAQFTTTYAAFPTASPATTVANAPFCTVTIGVASNATLVAEAQQDGATSYVYDSTVSDADFYTIASIPVTPASVVCVTTRGFTQKSDAGSRSGAVQLKSGGAVSIPTLNPSDQSNTTLSGGNLTATQTTTGGAGVRSTLSVTAGKWYWEVTLTSGSPPGIGIANATAALGTVWNVPTNAAIAYSSSIYVNNVAQSGAGFIISPGNTVGIALDVGAQLIWFRLAPSGNWNNSGTANPATGAGGISVSVLGTPLFALVATNNTGIFQTANFGQSGFTGAVPSGFAVGFGNTTGTTVASPTTALTAGSWAWLWRTDQTDPATSAAWTPVGVNNVNIGPVLIS